MDAGQELALSGVATALGIGLIWKGYEIYQSLDGLRAAIQFADDNSNSNEITAINNMITAAEQYFASSADYTQAQAIAGFVRDGLSQNDQQWFGHAIKAFLIREGNVQANSIDASDLSNLERLMEVFAEEVGDGETFEASLQLRYVNTR